MSDVRTTIDALKKWKEDGTHKGDLSNLRRGVTGDGQGDAIMVLAKLGAHLNGEHLQAWLLVGYLVACGIKDEPGRKAACFFSSGVSEERMRAALGSKDLASGIRRAAGILESVDLLNVFWSVVKWQDPGKRKQIQAEWWMSYYGAQDVSNKDED